MATEFVNGTLGRIEDVVLDAADSDVVKAIHFRPEGATHTLLVTRRQLQIAVPNVGIIARSQFPLIPA
jgi:hypothetical protein|tara:strand:+ start:78 stop:281 length:204 start_codon:yes stop_codon:yes gene_type:complete